MCSLIDFSILISDHESLIIAGYLIPKGWRIYVYTREINYDANLYEDPLIFNPWRWMVSIVLHIFNMKRRFRVLFSFECRFELSMLFKPNL